MGLFGIGRKPVVGAVILHRDGTRFLAAKRNYPAALTGRWELPGGKSEGNESPQATLRRELMEELGITVNVIKRLNGSVNVPNSDLRLQVWVVKHTGGAPRLIEGHSEIRWLTFHDMWDVNWLDSNERFVQQIPALLT
jgi:8-oxo-dGTP diphosphatase